MSLSCRDPVIHSLAAHLGEYRESGGGEYQFCSPFRDRFRDPRKLDRGFHLYVNPSKGSWIDFKTGLCGSVSYLFILLGERMPESSPGQAESLDDLSAALATLDAPVSAPRAELPDFYQPVTSGSRVYYYLRGRGLSDAEIAYYRIGEGKADKENILILPSFGADGRCDFWVTRRIDYDGTVKYRSPRGVPRRLHVGLLAPAIAFSPRHVVLCEGFFSAIVAGRDAVCTYGKKVSDSQLDIIAMSGITMVSLALDGDVEPGEVLDVAERCLRRRMRASVIRLPSGQDPADVGREGFYELRRQAVELDQDGVIRARMALLA